MSFEPYFLLWAYISAGRGRHLPAAIINTPFLLLHFYFLLNILYLAAYFTIMAQVHIGEAVKQFINKSRLKNGLRGAQIQIVWEEVMGKTIAKYTDRVEIRSNLPIRGFA